MCLLRKENFVKNSTHLWAVLKCGNLRWFIKLLCCYISDFLPVLIYVLVQCGMVSVEIEADYMWGLLHPSLLTGEGGYYLTSLSSAVLVLKNFREMQETKASQQEVFLRHFIKLFMNYTTGPSLPKQMEEKNPSYSTITL